MSLTTTAAPAPGVRRLTRALYAHAFLDDLVLLYPVYALLFADAGLPLWQISSLFALWSVTVVVLEVPSGALADALSRRLLLVAGPLCTATGFALWVLVPSYPAFAAGFVLWGVGGALTSGSLEALAYDELDRLGAAGRYARVMGRVRAARLAATLTAMALAGPVLALGGHLAVGAGSVLACLLAAAVAALLPEHRERPSRTGGPGWAGTLRAGLAEARGDRRVRGALLLVPAVAAVWGALEEYVPLLVRETGVADVDVPWFVLLVTAATASVLLAGPAERLGAPGLGTLLAASAVALVAGGGLGTPAGIALVGVAFGGFQLAEVLADVRLQHRIDDAARATLTSVASLGTELVTVGVFAGYGLLAERASHGGAFAVLAVPYLATAAVLWAVGARGRGRRRG